MAKNASTKGSSYETKQSLPQQPYSFPTIGDGITVMAGSLQEANEKAEAVRKNLEQYGSPEAPKTESAAAPEKSSDEEAAA